MENIINRNDITDEYFVEILKKESHHDHLIVDINGSYRWKENIDVEKISERIGMTNIINLFHILGYNKNSEIYRKFYRDIGYSLIGYWEIFYWEANNPIQKDYNPNNIIRKYKINKLSDNFNELDIMNLLKNK